MSLVTISDRAGKAIKENLLPNVQNNYWKIAKHPMLRYIGMDRNDQTGKGDGSSVTPRIRQVETIGIGRNFEILHRHTAGGGMVYSAAENTALRSGKYQAARSTATAKFLQGSFQISRQALAATRSKEFALIEEVTANAFGAVHSMHAEMNRMLVGNANAVLAYVDGAVSASTAVTTQTNTSATNEVPSTQHIHVGDELLVGTSAEIVAGTAESCTVASVTGDHTFTTTANETFADNDIIVRADAYNVSGSAYTEMTGLAALITATGTVQGVDKAANAWFQSAVTAVGGALTVAAIDAVIMKVRRQADDPSAIFILCNSKQWMRYAALLTSTKNIDPQTFQGNLAGGVKGLSYYSPDGHLPLWIDEMVPDGTIYIVDPNAFIYGEMQPFQFVDDALSVNGYSAQRLGGTLNYEFAFCAMGEFAQLNAPASGKLTGITS